MGSELPPFPVDDATLGMLEVALDPWSHGHPDAERSSLWDFLTLMSQMAGSDPRAVESVEDDGSATASHIARHDPARVLAEVEAKRRILDLHRSDGDQKYPACVCCSDIRECDDRLCSRYVEYPCETVRLLALPYAGRDGWREEWRP